MTGQIVIKSSTKPPNRRKQLLHKTLTSSPPPQQPPAPPQKLPQPPSSSVGEVAGLTAANCFIVCCCCPCVVLELLILALYKVPVTLGRRIWRHQRRRLILIRERRENNIKGNNKGKIVELSGVSEVYDKSDGELLGGVDLNMIKVAVDGSAVDLDKKMWEQFCETGFWRSSSQRDS